MNDELQKLVADNMGYVVTLARQYQSELLTTDDLVNEGAIGMMMAAERYDASRRKPFVTFAAPYIRQQIERALAATQGNANVRSTDESLPIGSGNNFTLLNVLEDTQSPRADHKAEQQSTADGIEHAIALLNEREEQVVRMIFGIGRHKMTMAEIGKEMGLRRERVRQIRDIAMRKMRKAGRALAD